MSGENNSDERSSGLVRLTRPLEATESNAFKSLLVRVAVMLVLPTLGYMTVKEINSHDQILDAFTDPSIYFYTPGILFLSLLNAWVTSREAMVEWNVNRMVREVFAFSSGSILAGLFIELANNYFH